MGVLNITTEQQCDYIADDFATHIVILPDDYIPDQVLHRKSQDNITYSKSQLLLDILGHTGLQVENGRVFKDKKCWLFQLYA